MKKYNKLSVLLIGLLIFGSQLFSQNDIAGTYYYQGDTSKPLAYIHVELFDLNDSLFAATNTDENGNYSIVGIPDGEYYLTSSTSLLTSGVTMADAHRVLKYIIGKITFNDMEFDVADVDNSTTVTMSDFVDIIHFVIVGQPFTGGEWEFENVSVDFSSRDYDSINPWGSSHGDVEGEWEPIGRDIDLMPSSYYSAQPLIKGTTTEYAVGADISGDINGFHMNFAYASDDISIVSLSGPDENFIYSIDSENGIIRLGWLNEYEQASNVTGNELFTMEVVLLNDIQQSSGEQLLTLLPGGMLFDSEDNKTSDIEIKLPLLKDKQIMSVEVDVFPNPVVNRINFNINSNKQSQASLSIYDLNGKLVNYIDGTAVHEGEQTITVNVENLLPGNYVYSFELKGENGDNVKKGRFVKSK